MTNAMRVAAVSSVALLVATGVAFAQSLTVPINRISENGVGDKIGTVTVTESKKGVSFKVDVTGLPAKDRGFHVHEKGDCAAATKDGKMVAGLAAGPHFDPGATKSHKGPEGMGHKGDLPLLKGTDKGIKQTVTAPHIKLADVKGRSLMIHDGGDNYTDSPENGGGGARVACGVIPK